MTIDPARTALILVEFQQQWTDPGLYRWLIARQLDGRSVVANTRAMVHQARAAGVTIVHAPLIIDPHHKKGWLAALTFGRVFRKGSDGAALTEGVHQDGDLVVTGRHAFDAFTGSDLEQLLRDHRMESILLAGFTTDQCVAKTAKTAGTMGFETYVLPECTATFSDWHQRTAENKLANKTLTNSEALRLLTDPSTH